MSWQEDYHKTANEISGEVGWTLKKIFFKVILPVMLLGIVLSTLSYALGWFSESAQVVKEEFGPRALLEKYEWFKDVAAQLDKKAADIAVYQNRVTALESSYEGTPRKDWDRTDKENFNLWQQELAGVIASFNGLAADYNAQMAKFNWRFASVGQLPEGAETALPREYKPYNYGSN